MAVLDGRGSCVARLGPADGFAGETGPQEGNDPGPFCATGDIDGDGRPDIVLHSPRRIRIYRGERVPKKAGPPGTGESFTLY